MTAPTIADIEISTAAGTLSQRQVAELFGVSRTAVYLVEKRALKKLFRALSMDPQIRAAFPDFFKTRKDA